MSDQPKRFDPIIDDDGLPAMDQFREGDYVLFSDYARLKSSLERLRKDASMMLSVYSDHYERLRKAGDAMALELEPSLKWNPDSDDIRYQVRLLNAAKEGNATK